MLTNLKYNEEYIIKLNDKKIEFFEIEDLEIRSKFNRQDTLITILILDLNKIKAYEDILSDSNLTLKIFRGKNTYFEGILKSIETYSDEFKYYIRLEAEDNSCKLNTLEEYSRIYQDNDITYSQIVEDVLKDKNLNYYISKNYERKIKGIIYQNEENDWEFLKRISSHINMPIFITKEGVLLFGYDNINDNVYVD